MALLGEEEGSSRAWGLVGLMGIVAGALILSYYSVIAGWSLAYIVEAVKGAFVDQDADGVRHIFESLVGSPFAVLGWHTLFMATTVFVVARGVERGLEKAVRIMVPALLAIMLVLFFYAVTSGGFGRAVEFMFRPDFSALTGQGVLIALGQAFFSLSVGMGAVMAYGAYLPDETSIPRASVAVVGADSFIAILSGLMIFPIVFANELSPAQGPGLVFQTLPLAFGNMKAGAILAPLFFTLLSFAAWTSAIAIMEPAVAYIVEALNWSRKRAAVLVGGTIWALGFATALSFNVLSGEDYRFLAGTLYDNIDYLTSNIMLPLGGLLITVFAGWVMSRNSSASELGGYGTGYKLWSFLARYVVPIAVLFVFLNATGLLKFD